MTLEYNSKVCKNDRDMNEETKLRIKSIESRLLHMWRYL